MLVYTMRKVGSSTVKATLQRALSGKGVKVRKCHYLSEGLHGRPLAWLRAMGCAIPGYMVRDGRTQEFLGEWRRHSRPYLGMGKCRVITLIRDPIATLVSDFFSSLQVTSPEFFGDGHCGDEAVREIRGLLAAQVDRQLRPGRRGEEHPRPLFYRQLFDIPLLWFERELKEVLGVDVLRKRFPTARGYGVYRGRDAVVLVIRFEDLNERGAEAVKDFLNVDVEGLHKANLSAEKPFYEQYRAFRDSLKMPGRFLDRYYSSPYARHFYSDAELDGFRRKWQE